MQTAEMDIEKIEKRVIKIIEDDEHFDFISAYKFLMMQISDAPEEFN